MSVSEEIRERWREQRRMLRMIDTIDDEFGSGGLAGYAEPTGIRIVVLPADPDDHDVVKFDDSSRDWLEQTQLAPWNDREAIVWGSYTTVTSNALVRTNQTQAAWTRYLALHRHGGLEAGFADLAWTANDRQVFPLRPIVGAMWATLALQADAATRWSVAGPWQVILALRSTEGAVLTNFAEGWAEPFHIGRTTAACKEANVLFRWEATDLAAEVTALDAGTRVDNAFGTTSGRHLAQRGEFVGQLDPRFGL